jgi:hypothetical protein
MGAFINQLRLLVTVSSVNFCQNLLNLYHETVLVRSRNIRHGQQTGDQNLQSFWTVFKTQQKKYDVEKPISVK